MKPLAAHIAAYLPQRFRFATAWLLRLAVHSKDRSWIILAAILFLPTLALGQYGNEWIEYNVTYYKFSVTRQGVYRIHHDALSAIPQANFSGAQHAQFNLFNKGQAVPLYIHDDNGNGIFEQNDYIEFFAERNDGWFDGRLYADPANQQPNPYVSMFNDTAVYYLAANTQIANKRISNIANDLTNLPSQEQYFMHRLRYSFSQFFPGKWHLSAGEKAYESVFAEGEGFTSQSIPDYPQHPLQPTQRYYNAQVNAHLHARISVNPSNQFNPMVMRLLINSYEFPADTFTNQYFKIYDYDFPMDAFPTSGLQYFFSYLSNARKGLGLLEITYPREFTFPNESRTFFTLNAGAGPRFVEISAFTDNGTAPILYDLTNSLRIVGAPALGTGRNRFKLPAQSSNAKRELFITSQSASDLISISGSSISRINFINYNNPSLQGDYIILTHPKLRNDGSGNDYVGEYARYRGNPDGGGHQVVIAHVDHLYDQFGYGIRKHPQAIRNFMDFTMDKWSKKPEHLFIIGKGRLYTEMRYGSGSSAAYHQCLVPTFGHPGSDVLLAATNTSIIPRAAVGRLSVENANDVNLYLEKVKSYERKQREAGDPYQTIDNKLWMKRVMHMGGGEGSAQQNQFKSYLRSYQRTIEDTLYGGTVYEFYKTSTAPIQYVQSDFMRELINTGVSLITFFGHSSANSFDIAIDDPETYSNFEKYHLILSNGCFTGNIYNAARGISERFVLADGKAAIGFISTISFSNSTPLNFYSDNFYKNLGQKFYGKSVGTAMKKTCENAELTNNTLNKIIAQEMTLHGDPGIKLNTHAKPDYALEPKMVSFEPATVSIEQDSFQIKIIVTNLGMAVNDSVNLIVTRTFPNIDDGSVSYVKRMRGTYFSDTVYFDIPTGSNRAFGLNTFYIKIDNDEEVNELSETNNVLGGLTLNITSEDIFPIHPYEFAIVPQQPITLKASTANVFAPMNTYRLEIDTTELFNSPLLKSTVITQTGGVVTWTPPLVYMDSVVYYWRAGVEGRGTFNYSSFIYLRDEYPGWNQSHYYQYLKDNYNNVYLDNDRIFKYVDDVKTVSVKTGTANFRGGGLPDDQMAYHLNGGLKHRWNCGGPGGFNDGIVIAVFDSATGNNWISKNSDAAGGHPCSGHRWNTVHGNIHCKTRDAEGFDFPTTNACYMDKIVAFINSVPDGNYILAYSINAANYANWTPDLVNTFVNLGSQLLPGMLCCGNIPWAFFAQKGNPAFATEMRGNGIADVVNFTASFSAQWYEGTMTTPLIGPAYEWGSVHWKHHALEPDPNDQQSIDIIGVGYNGSESLVYSGLKSLDTTIEFINANSYPYIRMRMNTRDDVTRTPAQLDYWRVLYKKVPEAALSPNIHFSFRDSVMMGENLTLSVACENVTEIHMTPLLVKYSLMSSGFPPVYRYVRYDSLKALETMNLDWSFNTECNCLGDLNTLVIEVNPIPEHSTGILYDQPEQFHFNNYGILTFKMDKDRVNPLLDVTFDNVHILDGDIVSAYPEIKITLKDENRFLLLDDTSLVNVFLVDPNNERIQMRYDQVTMRFERATSGTNNRAQIFLKKEFEQNGTYSLQIQARDRSRNISGTYGIPQDGIDYRISFKVIREAMITNVLNYPNPFTSSTRFVFTLTGMQPPDFFKIQIMTVSGKVVRELTQYDLGPLRVGNNITEYAWNGTDEFGDPLGNGLYLYRVVASIGGKSINKWEGGPDKNTDKYFKSGFGKMYLAR